MKDGKMKPADDAGNPVDPATDPRTSFPSTHPTAPVPVVPPEKAGPDKGQVTHTAQPGEVEPAPADAGPSAEETVANRAEQRAAGDHPIADSTAPAPAPEAMAPARVAKRDAQSAPAAKGKAKK